MSLGREKELKRIKEEVLNLKDSPLYPYRLENNYLPVVGEGSAEAKIMLVGEAPGENEAKCGRPFCGRAGKVLDMLLAEAGLNREEVYITSIVKDRPPKNRDPKPEEIKVYAPFLDRQIEVIKPMVVAALGRHAMEYIMNRYGLVDKLNTISKIHGHIFEAKSFKFIPLYHPAAAIYNNKLMSDLKSDIKKIKQY